MAKKKVLILSDFHSGHRVGLTPPGWQTNPRTDGTRLQYISLQQREYYAKLQRECYDFYEWAVKRHGPYDIVIINGDLIDGRGERSKSTEVISADRHEQADMATEAAKVALSKKTKKIIITRGTPYHTGDGEDFEDGIATRLGAEIGDHLWVDINGVIFDLKHDIGGGSSPVTTAPLKKEHIFNMVWAEHDMAPKSDVIIRSHLHFHEYVGNADFLGMVTPALQAAGSKFGMKRCSKYVNFGIVVFEIDDQGRYSWFSEVAEISGQKANVIKA